MLLKGVLEISAFERLSGVPCNFCRRREIFHNGLRVRVGRVNSVVKVFPCFKN